MMHYTPESILQTVDNHCEEFRKLGVRRLGLFGSAARGELQAQSDLDFLVDLDCKCFDAYMDVKLLLESIFDRRVDLVLQHTIKPRLRASILNEARYAPGL